MVFFYSHPAIHPVQVLKKYPVDSQGCEVHRQALKTMNATDRQIVERLKRILEQRVRLHQIILFGSRARGDHDAESDMDVLVILDSLITPEIRDAVSECTWQVGFDAGIIIAAVLFSREEWEEGPEYYSPLAEAVRADGVAI